MYNAGCRVECDNIISSKQDFKKCLVLCHVLYLALYFLCLNIKACLCASGVLCLKIKHLYAQYLNIRYNYHYSVNIKCFFHLQYIMNVSGE